MTLRELTMQTYEDCFGPTIRDNPMTWHVAKKMGERMFLKALQLAADNADADLTFLSSDGQHYISRLEVGEDYEVGISRESILSLKDNIPT